jgi:hypothetical protein
MKLMSLVKGSPDPGLALACAFVSVLQAIQTPLIGAFWAEMFIAVAWAIRRGQAWAAFAAAACLLFPLVRLAATMDAVPAKSGRVTEPAK